MSAFCPNVCRIQEKVIKILRDIAQTTQENPIIGITQLTDLQDSVSVISEMFQEYEEAGQEKEQEMKELKGNISALSKRLGDLDSAIDRKKQYPRQYCLLLHGLEEESNRNTDQRVIDVSNESMGEPIRYLFKILRKSSDSLEKKRNGKSRPVIVTFILYNTRYLTYKNRKNLK